MPRAWTVGDEEQYEAISRQLRLDGKKAKEAKEIAARTVNKRRRLEGRTANKTSMGTGNPNSRLATRTVVELRNLARQHGIPGRSKMNKRELVSTLGRKQR